MRSSLAFRAIAIASFAPLASCVACGGDGDPPDGAISEVAPDASEVVTAWDASDDAAPSAENDASMPPSTMPIVDCGRSRAALPDGETCEVHAGGAARTFVADVLALDRVLLGGEVLVDASGWIACVACDCSDVPGASDATRIECPSGVLSPGLVNAHEHLSYQGWPAALTDERYEHRHDWRRGQRGHTAIDSRSGTREEVTWAELRAVMSGTTSINGSGGQPGLARNLDGDAMEGLGHEPATYDTFPLDDVDGTLLTSGCAYGDGRTTAAEATAAAAYVPHLAEGIDGAARNELTCTRDGSFGLLGPTTALVHDVAALAIDAQDLAAAGGMLVWSPRSNLALYGDTARVTTFDRLGVPIALGTDWIFTGSSSLLRELRCADELNADYLDAHFDDVALWRMATLHGAMATGVDDVIGSIAVGRVADLVVFEGAMHPLHRAVIDAEPADVALVLRAGAPLFGEAHVVAALADDCETLDVCGEARSVCIADTGTSFKALRSANGSSYPLFSCGAPPSEPTCRPARMGAMAEIAGSIAYDGLARDGDHDGDGIDDELDLCPRVFDPIRPLDQGVQADADGDEVGDACDPCPLDEGATECAPVDPRDRDRDGHDDGGDVCPDAHDPEQLDADGDGRGDACDECPNDANAAGAACPATIYELRTGTVALGARRRVHGVVSALATDGAYVQVASDDAAYSGAERSGIFVYTGATPDGAIERGSRVRAEGASTDFFGELQLARATLTLIAPGAPPTPEDATPAAIVADPDAYEGVLVRVVDVRIATTTPTQSDGEPPAVGEVELVGGLRVDDRLHAITPPPVQSERFASIAGVVAFRWGRPKLLPRDAADVAAEIPMLDRIVPALSFARVGVPGVTFPEPLTVHLARAVSRDVVVTIRSASAGLEARDVLVPAGATSATVGVHAVRDELAPIDVTAILGGTSRTATVRALDADALPTSLTIAPTAMLLASLQGARFDVTLDVPAPIGGLQLAVDDPTGGDVAASLFVPADATIASLEYRAPAVAATGDLVVSTPSCTASARISVVEGAPGSVVINEIDYDQTGPDAAEFVELLNPGVTPASLDGLALVLVDGNRAREYARVELSGALAPGAYAVIATAGVVVPTGARRFALEGTTNVVQNGPDGVALLHLREGRLVDALSYGGEVREATIDGRTYSLVEGTVTLARDSPATSLGRTPNGSDTNDAAMDWRRTRAPSPGAANDAAM